jgi:hypothetical protein
MIIAHALIAQPDKFVALRYQQESVFSIELGDTGEGQLSLISGDPFSEEGFTCLPFSRSAPLPYVQNQRAVWSKRPGECCLRTLRQLGVFCLRLPENRDVGVRVFPEREEILVGSLRLGLVS